MGFGQNFLAKTSVWNFVLYTLTLINT